MPETSYLSRCFSSTGIALITFALSQAKTCVIRHKWGRIGPSNLLSEHGDPSFLFHFWTVSLLYLINGQSLIQILCWVLFLGNDLKNVLL